MTEPHQLEEAIFEAARHLPEGRRTAYVEMACGKDVQMFGRVQERLLTHRPVAQPSGSPTDDAPTASGNWRRQPPPLADNDETITATVVAGGTLPRMPEEAPGDRIGRYQLLEKIGEGGFGVVYMAEQREPVRRRVALKITKLGMDTKQVVGRFEAERQALALMDHPNIASVIDGGATETGRPFFVMELVRGIRITDYCDQNKLPLRKRLALFIQVCQAVEHAHSKGVIHRDIKPSNILVTLHDGVPVCKVIDFGIAKAALGTLTDKTVFTQFDQFVGTPAYMSPEQAEMSGLEVDQRSDIYSLGVLLYELLTGHTPFEAKGLLARGFDEMRRIIREIEPLRPSNRLGKQTGDELNSTASQHGTDAPKLISLIRGDLDWVVMKCLEKDRTRRYESAAKLSKEIQRFLVNQPVLARPPSPFYRFQKLVMRNRLAFGASTVFFTSLFIGLCVTTYYVIKEKDARDLADNTMKSAESDRQIAEKARSKAQAALKESEAQRQIADAARQKAEESLQQSEADRAKAEAAEKRALDSQKEAETARQEAEGALQQSLEDRKKAEAALEKARSSQTQAEAAENRATTEAGKSEEATKAAVNEASLRQQAETARQQAELARQQAEAAATTALATAASLNATVSNIVARLAVLPPAEALKVGSVIFSADDEKQPWAARYLRQRGEWHALTGDWTNAIQDFSKAIELGPDDQDSYHALAPLLVQNDELEAYGNLRSRFLARFGGANDPPGVPLLTADWLLTPFPAAEQPLIAGLAQPLTSTETNAQKLAQNQLALGLADYRLGRYPEALDLTEKAVNASAQDPAINVQACAVLAMVQRGMKQPDEARATWTKAAQTAAAQIPRLDSNDPGPDWREWMLARPLLHEAQTP